jgi:hypothetical protein
MGPEPLKLQSKPKFKKPSDTVSLRWKNPITNPLGIVKRRTEEVPVYPQGVYEHRTFLGILRFQHKLQTNFKARKEEWIRKQKREEKLSKRKKIPIHLHFDEEIEMEATESKPSAPPVSLRKQIWSIEPSLDTEELEMIKLAWERLLKLKTDWWREFCSLTKGERSNKKKDPLQAASDPIHFAFPLFSDEPIAQHVVVAANSAPPAEITSTVDLLPKSNAPPAPTQCKSNRWIPEPQIQEEEKKIMDDCWGQLVQLKAAWWTEWSRSAQQCPTKLSPSSCGTPLLEVIPGAFQVFSDQAASSYIRFSNISLYDAFVHQRNSDHTITQGRDVH